MIKKAKGIYLYTTDGKRCLDLSTNLNIIGHSHRRLTTVPKDALSTAWNIRGDSVYHRRFTRLLTSLYGSRFAVFCASSMPDLLLRLLYNGMIGEPDLINALPRNAVIAPVNHSAGESKKIINAAEKYLHGEPIAAAHEQIINGYDYPLYDVPTDADAVILPELLGGYTTTVFVLVDCQKATDYAFLDRLESVPSFALIAAMKLHFVVQSILKQNPQLPTIRHPKILQNGRLLSFGSYHDAFYEKLLAQNILINQNARYAYLPINPDEHVIKRLGKAFSVE